jgi:hypothetical protein
MSDNNSNTKVKILLVGGIDVSGSGKYDSLVDWLDHNGNNKVQYFLPKFDKSFDDSLSLLDKIVTNKKFDILMGHGLGCLLLTHLIKKKHLTNTKIIFSNPIFINPSFITFLLSLYPDALTSYIPSIFKQIAIPRNYLTYNTERLAFSDYFETISLTFIISAFKYANSIEPTINIFDTYKNNIFVIHGMDDMLSLIPNSIQDRLAPYVKFITMDTCKHMPFHDYKTIQNNYKHILLDIIDKFSKTTGDTELGI